MASSASDRPLLLQACLNGSRRPRDHPAVPVSPEVLAAAATEAVAGGAAALHIHQRDAHGAQTLAADPCGWQAAGGAAGGERASMTSARTAAAPDARSGMCGRFHALVEVEP